MKYLFFFTMIISIFAKNYYIMTEKWYNANAPWAKFVFRRDSYDPFIDYLKGICIIFVIINHCMPENIMDSTAFFFWGVSAVPIFLIIQVFHAYKRELKNAKTNNKRLWKKIVWPFFVAEFVIFVVFIIRDHHFTIYYKEKKKLWKQLS